MANNIEYINNYNKEHYRQFKVVLKPDEYKQLEDKLKSLKMTKTQFVRNALEELLKKWYFTD